MIFYKAISVLLFPFLELYLFYRVLKKKEDKKRLKERFGKPTKDRPDGHVIWFHAVSVGEANSAMFLVEEMLKFSPNISILFTTTTLTSAEIVSKKAEKSNGKIIHQFLPIDSLYCVRDFLDFWQPRAALFVESEIWPNLINEARSRGVSSYLINARMSEKSIKKWKNAKLFGFKIFDYFAAIFAQTTSDKKRIETLTSQEVFLYGNLKSQITELVCDENELGKLEDQIGNRKFWLAASTHKGEEEIILETHKELKKEFPDLLTIIIPRHPNRSKEVQELLKGYNFSKRSSNEDLTDANEIYLADTLGELGVFYRLADFALIGGSMMEIGGHNPFEAIKLGCAVISGREVFNFKEIYKDLEEKEACIMVDSKEQLIVSVKKCLTDQAYCRGISSKALDLVGDTQDIAQRIIKRIDQDIMIGI